MAESYEIHLTDPQTSSFSVRAFTSNGPIFPISPALNNTATAASTSLVIYGKGHPNYGERIAEDILHVMENFAGGTPPTNPVIGQTWYGRNTIIRRTFTTGAFPYTFYTWVVNPADVTYGGYWELLDTFDPVIYVQPTDPADSATPPDGSYWYDDAFDILYYRINNSGHPMSPTWIRREYDEYGIADPAPNAVPPRQFARTFNGTSWIDVRTVTTSDGTLFIPNNPIDGSLWIDNYNDHFNYYVSGAFNEVATTLDLVTGLALKIDRAGDIMDNPGTGGGPGVGGGGLNMNNTPLANVLGMNMTDDILMGTNQILNTGFIGMAGDIDMATNNILNVGLLDVTSGNINMNSTNSIVNVASILMDPTGTGINMSNTPITNVNGMTLSGNLDMGTNDIINVGNITVQFGNLDMVSNNILNTGLIEMIGPINMFSNSIIDLGNTNMVGNLDMGSTNSIINIGSIDMLGNINMNTNLIVDVGGMNMTGDIDMGISTITNLTYLAMAGGIEMLSNNIANVGALNMLGNIDMGTNFINNVLDPVLPQDAATMQYVIDEIAVAVPPFHVTALPDLTDVNAATTPTAGNFLKGNGIEWAESVIVWADLSDVTTVSLTELGYLDGVTSAIQPQIDGKMSLATGGIIGAGGLITLTDTPLAPANNDLVIAAYVNQQIAAIPSDADGVLVAAAYDALTKELTLDTEINAVPLTTFNVDMSHTHDALEIPYVSTQRVLRNELPATYPNFNVQEALEAAIDNLNTRLEEYETFAGRELFTATAAQTNFTFTEPEYLAGTNRLTVHVNGVKQYADERAHQGFFLDATVNASPTSPHGLADGTYDLDIAVDGAAVATMNITVTNGTSTNLTVADIITQINLDILTVTAKWDSSVRGVIIHSNATGAGSQITITDGIVNGILAAIAAVGVATNLPLFVAPDIAPLANGPITQVTANRDYKETTPTFLETIYGAAEFNIAFNAGLTVGDIVEVITEPAFFSTI